MNKKTKIPDPTIERLPIYFRCLSELKNLDIAIVSSEEISNRTGIKASQFRKDLSYFGEFGIQGLGYPVIHLFDRVSEIMQLNKQHQVAICGMGNLGRALVNYEGFSRWGLIIRHLFDNDPEKIGNKIAGLEIEDISRLPRDLEVDMGIITVPAPVAQDTANLMIRSGVKAILNFTAVNLSATPDIAVRNVDLTNELAILLYHMSSHKKKNKKSH